MADLAAAASVVCPRCAAAEAELARLRAAISELADAIYERRPWYSGVVPSLLALLSPPDKEPSE